MKTYKLSILAAAGFLISTTYSFATGRDVPPKYFHSNGYSKKTPPDYPPKTQRVRPYIKRDGKMINPYYRRKPVKR